MAVPDALFQVKAGVALMRYDSTLNEWFFVAWVNKGVHLDTVTPGRTYGYALWLVVGYAVTTIVSMTVNGTSRLVIMQAAK